MDEQSVLLECYHIHMAAQTCQRALGSWRGGEAINAAAFSAFISPSRKLSDAVDLEACRLQNSTARETKGKAVPDEEAHWFGLRDGRRLCRAFVGNYDGRRECCKCSSLSLSGLLRGSFMILHPWRCASSFCSSPSHHQPHPTPEGRIIGVQSKGRDAGADHGAHLIQRGPHRGGAVQQQPAVVGRVAPSAGACGCGRQPAKRRKTLRPPRRRPVSPYRNEEGRRWKMAIKLLRAPSQP